MNGILLARNPNRKELTFCKDCFEIYLSSVYTEAISFYESSLMCQVYLKFMKYNTQQHTFNIFKYEILSESNSKITYHFGCLYLF